MPADPVHMLRSHLSGERGAPTLTARCGATQARRPANGPFPDTFTAWEGDVSCPDCTLNPQKENE